MLLEEPDVHQLHFGERNPFRLVDRPRLILPRCGTRTAWKRSKLRGIEHEFPAILFFSRGPQERTSMDGARVAFEAMFRPCRAAVYTHKTRFMEVSLASHVVGIITVAD